jgi:hypothetical protein
MDSTYLYRFIGIDREMGIFVFGGLRPYRPTA